MTTDQNIEERGQLVAVWVEPAYPQLTHVSSDPMRAGHDLKRMRGQQITNVQDWTLLTKTKDGKMMSTPQIHRNRRCSERKDHYATEEDFQKLFATEVGELFHLSLQLTADIDKAESCLILAMRDCFSGNTVSKEWAYTWARRMVIRNAIHIVLGQKNETARELLSEVCTQPRHHSIKMPQESVAILALPDLNRLAFVICVFERYSILDAALLLRKTPKDVNDAISRATNRIASELNHPGAPGKLRAETYFKGCSDGGELDGGCGTILE
jgi:DNA-directed RNA polymerase specialized sigma24 family protein